MLFYNEAKATVFKILLNTDWIMLSCVWCNINDQDVGKFIETNVPD